MKAKRLLAMVLILCLVFSLLPAFSITALADEVKPEEQAGSAADEPEKDPAEPAGETKGTDKATTPPVTYYRYTGPEVAILNANTGSSPKFYESIMKNASYNAVEQGYFRNGTETLKYDFNNGKNKTFTWPGFVDTNLAFLSDQTHQIKINYSVTLQNNIHEHSWKKDLFTKYTQECYGRMSAQLWFNGADREGTSNGPFFPAQYNNQSKVEYVRKGDMDYSNMPIAFDGTRTAHYYMVGNQYVYDWGRRSDLNLTFTNQDYYYDYGNKTCTCGGWVNKHFVGFYDGEAPTVKRVDTRLKVVNETTGAVDYVETSDFKPGDTVQVVLHMNEPVRFADDSATGKENIYIGLGVNGSTSMRYARLVSMENLGYYSWNPHDYSQSNHETWALYFEYTAEATESLLDFVSVNLTKAPSDGTPLIHAEADINLLQLKGSGAFHVDMPSDVDGKHEGFDKAKSYVTDMAGNSLVATVPSASFRVDGQRPFVAKVVIDAELNNDAAKQGKNPEDANWADNSDTYLGQYDRFSLNVFLNEVVSYEGDSRIASVTTNIIDENGNPLVIPLRHYWNVDAKKYTGKDGYGLGASEGLISMLKSAGSVQIRPGMTLAADPAVDTITILAINYNDSSNVIDNSGNVAWNEPLVLEDVVTMTGEKCHLAPDKGFHLDVTPPSVVLGDTVQDAPNEPFYVPFQVDDGADGSGVEDMRGSVQLFNSGEGGCYEYTVSIYTVPPTDAVWKQVKFGDNMPIVEQPQQQYLHVRRADTDPAQIYNFNGITARFMLSDYAGNIGHVDKALTGAIFDNVPPSLYSYSATRSYDNEALLGTMLVPVVATDIGGLKSVSYLWADDDPELVITAESEGWTPLLFSTTDEYPSRVQDSIPVELGNGGYFSKVLWLMAEDAGGNVRVEKKTLYTYSLKALAYELDYTTSVSTEFDISYVSMDNPDGVILVDIRKKGEVDEDNKPVHYICVGMAGGFNQGNDNIFDGGFAWYRATLDETDGHVFTLLPDQGDGMAPRYDYFYDSDTSSYYNGELEVTVYAGTTQSIQNLRTHDTQWGIRWWYNGQSEPIVMDNSVGIEKFTLRRVAENDNLIDHGDEARIQCMFTYVDPMLTNKNPEISAGTVSMGVFDVFDYYELNKSLAGAVISFELTDTYGWDFDDIDWDNSYLRLSNYWGDWWQDDSTAVRICGINKGAVQTVVIPACDIPNGRYENVKLVLARLSAPDDPYWWYVRGDGATGHANYLIGGEYAVDLDVDIDNTEAGSLQPGLLSYQPYTKFFNYGYDGNNVVYGDGQPNIAMEMNDWEFPRFEIAYDPAEVIHVPGGKGRLDLMFQCLDAEGNPALRKPYVTDRVRAFGQYDVWAWNTSADDPDSTLCYLQSDCASTTGTGYYARGLNENQCFQRVDPDATGVLDSGYKITQLPNAGEYYGQLNLSFTIGDRNTVYDSYGDRSRQLRLIPDQDNVIAVQMHYVNGETSDIVYLTIHPDTPTAEPQGVVTVDPEPVEEDANHPWGTIVGAPGEVSFRYTPAEGENTAGLTFYLYEGYSYFMDSRPGVTHSSGGQTWTEQLAVNRPVTSEDRVEMTLQGDGSYLAYVPDQGEYIEDQWGGLRHYVVVAEDAMGNLFVVPGPQNSVIIDSMGPAGECSPTTEVENGTFTVDYDLSDATLAACVSRWEQGPGLTYYSALAHPTGGPLKLTFTVDEDYAALIGANSLTVYYDPVEAERTGTVTYEGSRTWHKTIVSEIPVTGNALGISSITATLDLEHGTTMAFGMNQYATLHLSVKGGVSPKLTTPTDVTLTLSMEDCFGNDYYTYIESYEGGANLTTHTEPSVFSTVLEDAVGIVPQFASAEYKLTGNTMDGWQQDRALYMTFTGPVKPVASWINPDPVGYSEVWADGFPITKDGEWEISYYDMNDILHTETITLTDVFGEYGVEFSFSTEDYTQEPIVLTADGEGTTADGHKDLMAILPNPADGMSFETVYYGQYTASREVENGEFVLIRCPYSGSPREDFTDLSFRRQYADYLVIHVGNFVNGRPDENVTIYFHDTGRAYAAGSPEQRTGTTDDRVVLSYRTGRPTQAVGDGETSKTFRAGDDDSFSFTYYDPITDEEYTIEGTLSGTYGVTLVPPAEPPEDNEAPQINRVTVWRQLGARFEQAEAFRGDAAETEIEEVFSLDRTGRAQGYDLVVNASDVSAWRLVLCSEEPAALTYDAENAAVTGVTIQGNNVLITADVENYEGDAFWIAAVDEFGNFSFFKLMKSWFAFDTVAPTLICSDAQVTDFFVRTVFIRATDKDNTGSVLAGGVTVTGEGVVPNDGSNSAYPAADWPWMIVFTENTTGSGVPVTATDTVGNAQTAWVTVEGIDDSKPTISVTWSPCFRGAGSVDETNPPMNPVNVFVVAHITSDKNIAGVEGLVELTTAEYPDFREEYDLPYGIPDPSGWLGIEPVSFDYSDKMVTVYFTQSEEEVGIDTDGDGWSDVYPKAAMHVSLRVYAPNGGYADAYLDLTPNIIDMNAPYIDDLIETPLYHQKANGDDYDCPYGYEFTLYLSEDCYLSGNDYVGAPGVLHPESEPFTFTVLEGDYTEITLTDKAGNVYTDDLDLDYYMDSEPPVLSIVNMDGIGTSAPAAVKIRIDDDSGPSEWYVNDPTGVTLPEFDLNNIEIDTDEEGNTYGILTVTVNRNGAYRLTVVDAAGNEGTLIFGVSKLDLTQPAVRFSSSTVTLRMGSTAAELAALLDEGVTLWDNVDDAAALAATLSYDVSAVDLNEPGLYQVPYTTVDSAGNVGRSIRMVRVLSDKLPSVRIDGKLTEMNGTMGLMPGAHTLTVSDLGVPNEPYKVTLVKGIWSEGQIKYVTTGIPVGDDGSFTLSAGGYYTLYILTQSRMGYRTLLYASN